MFSIGQIIFVLISTATAPGIVSARGVMADVIEVSEKAVRLQLGTRESESVWLPKAALIQHKERPDDFRLAPWFKANDYQWTMFEKHSAPSFSRA